MYGIPFDVIWTPFLFVASLFFVGIGVFGFRTDFVFRSKPVGDKKEA